MAVIPLVSFPSPIRRTGPGRPPIDVSGLREAAISRADAGTALIALDRAQAARGIERLDRERKSAEACAIILSCNRPKIGNRLRALWSKRRKQGVARDLRERGLLIDEWYCQRHSVGHFFRNALPHFLEVGMAANLAPNPFFDPVWYRREYQLADHEVAISHYMDFGSGVALSPGPLFSSVDYLKLHPELAMERDLLGHYLRLGIVEGRRAPVVGWHD